MTIYNVLAGPRNTSSGRSLYTANKRRTLVLLGDSITWGLGVLQYQTYAQALQTKIDTVVGGSNTARWVARNVQADDIVIGRDTGTPWFVPFKLQSAVGLSYDNDGPFSSSFSNTISSTTGPAILMNSENDEFTVTPSTFEGGTGVQYLTIMVKVTGTGSATIECPGFTPIAGTVAAVGGSNIGVNNIYRFIYDTGSSSTSFTIRRTDAAGGALARILSVNPTNLYPQAGVGNFATTGYINVQINARGSYVFADYSDDMASIHESIIFPTSDAGSPDVPAYVIALGTVNMYFDPSLDAVYDRREEPGPYRDALNTLVNAIKTVSPTSPIFLTHPPIATSPWVLKTGFTRSQYDSQIQSVAISQNLPVIDLRSTLVSTDYSDGIHPTANGQDKLAETYIAALRL